MRKKEVFRLNKDDEDRDRNKDTKYKIAAEQVGHISHVEGIIYARGIMERDKEVTSKR
jgi:hypothetical protein